LTPPDSGASGRSTGPGRRSFTLLGKCSYKAARAWTSAFPGARRSAIGNSRQTDGEAEPPTLLGPAGPPGSVTEHAPGQRWPRGHVHVVTPPGAAQASWCRADLGRPAGGAAHHPTCVPGHKAAQGLPPWCVPGPRTGGWPGRGRARRGALATARPPGRAWTTFPRGRHPSTSSSPYLYTTAPPRFTPGLLCPPPTASRSPLSLAPPSPSPRLLEISFLTPPPPSLVKRHTPPSPPTSLPPFLSTLPPPFYSLVPTPDPPPFSGHFRFLRSSLFPLSLFPTSPSGRLPVPFVPRIAPLAPPPLFLCPPPFPLPLPHPSRLVCGLVFAPLRLPFPLLRSSLSDLLPLFSRFDPLLRRFFPPLLPRFLRPPVSSPSLLDLRLPFSFFSLSPVPFLPLSSFLSPLFFPLPLVPPYPLPSFSPP